MREREQNEKRKRRDLQCSSGLFDLVLFQLAQLFSLIFSVFMSIVAAAVTTTFKEQKIQNQTDETFVAIVLNKKETILFTLLNWAFVELVLHAQRQKDEYKVEEEHGKSHAFGHFPVEEKNGQKYQHEHGKEDSNVANHSF